VNRGILLMGEFDPVIKSGAQKSNLEFIQGSEYALPFEKTLLVKSGTRVPWDLLPAAWAFLDRWDAACPLWRYGETAENLGTKKERQITQDIIRDLRVLLYSHELLFVRKNEAGIALLEKWQSEMERGPDQRLAFLRAYYQVKPRLCALPISWLAEVRASSVAFMRARNPRIDRMKKSPMVRVKIGPGRFVKCHKGDEERVKAYHAEQGRN